MPISAPDRGAARAKLQAALLYRAHRTGPPAKQRAEAARILNTIKMQGRLGGRFGFGFALIAPPSMAIATSEVAGLEWPTTESRFAPGYGSCGHLRYHPGVPER